MFVFRVDSNSMIGVGHMYRCVAIAKALKIMGKEVMFVCREDSDVSMLQQSFLPYRFVPSVRLGSEEAINTLKDIMCELRANVCIVDSCDIDNTGLKSLKEKCKVVLIEDKLYEVMDVDCIINPNIYTSKLNYENKYPNNVDLLLGMDYSPCIIDAISGNKKKQIGDIKNLLVFVGENDRYELAPGIVDSLLDILNDDVRVRVVTSKYSATKDRLFKMSNYSSQIVVEQDVVNFSKLLNSCDAAVFSADAVCYDLLRYNVPSCIFVSDDSQQTLMDSFVENNLAIYGGNYIKNKNKFYGELVIGVIKLMTIKDRQEIILNIEKLNLGNGAENIAKAILKYE